MAEMEQATNKKPDAKLLVELLLMGGGKLNFSTFLKVFLFSEDPEEVKKREQEMIFKEIKKREEMYQKSLRAKRMKEESIEEKKMKEEESIRDFDKRQDRDDIWRREEEKETARRELAARQEEVRNKLQQAIDKNDELTDELMDGVTAMMISESRTVTPRLQVQNQTSEYVYARTVSNLQTDLTHILRINEEVSENMREYASGVVSSKE
jgi:histone deacetylase complex regulatory component SIN3